MIRLRTFLLLACIVLAAAGVTAIAAAQVGDDGVIHACVKANGSLRVVETGTACGAGETPLEWNQEGRQGETGPQGPPGPPRLFITRNSAPIPPDSTSPKQAVATCDPGQQLVGGGFKIVGGGNTDANIPKEVSVTASVPAGSGWSVRAAETTPTTVSWGLVAFAQCTFGD